MAGPTDDGPIRFDDGAAYERYMGAWSQRAGARFLDWLGLPPGLRWLDVGCGNGAFTALLDSRADPSEIVGIDPAEGQLRYARTRPVARKARFEAADAMALPFADDRFDVAVMPLVIFFVPEPVRGVAEMVRVVRPGGTVCAYAWDMLGGGFPYDGLRAEVMAAGHAVPRPPSPEASDLDAMSALWRAAGLQQVATTRITVERTFADFDDWWQTVLCAPSLGATLAGLSSADAAALQSRLRARLGVAAAADGDAPITSRATANAIRGTVVPVV